MQAFEYANPRLSKRRSRCSAPNWGEADVLAGGTDLISLMKEYLHTPKRVVNIKGIKELGGIEDRVRAGPPHRRHRHLRRTARTTRWSRKSYPSLPKPARGVTSPQIRNMGTVGGDLCQRPRCWYFRRASACSP